MQISRGPGEVVRFGPFEADLLNRELRKNGTKIRLQSQPFLVLAALLQKPGTAVSREELRRRVWPDDTFVDFEHGLNAAVTRLRQALGDSADKPRYIETVPKYGYRFCANLQTGDAGLLEPEAPAVPVSPPRRRTLGILLFLAGVVSGATIIWLVRDRSEEPELRSVPLTSFPGYEAHPALSPDDRYVAFTWNGERQDNFDIYVIRIGSDSPIRLTSDPAEDIAPAWSPDGRTIAFVRRIAGDRGELRLIAATGGPEHKLDEIRSMELRFSRGRFTSLAWSPDGQWIAVSHREPEDVCQRIYLFSRTGERRPITSPAVSGLAGDLMPAFSPDGKILAVNRLTGPNTGNIYVQPLDSMYGPAGEARALTKDDRSFEPVWLTGGRILYFSGLPENHMELLVIDRSEAHGSSRGLPRVEEPRDAAVGRHLVYSQARRNVNIWRAAIAATGEAPTPAERFISSTRVEAQPKYSPDGNKIAYTSSRSGAIELWVSNSDGSSRVRITDFRGPLVGQPNWSPDGHSLVFHARPEGQADLFIIPAAGGPAKRLTTDPHDDTAPSYSRDGQWIYFTSARSGQTQVWKMPAAGGEAVQLTATGGYRPFESPDRTVVYYYALDNTGIWSVPVNGGQSAKVVDALHDYPSGFAVMPEGLYYAAPPHSGSDRFVQFYSFSTRTSRPVALARRPFGFGMTVSPDSKFVLFDQQDDVGSDLMLIENFNHR